MKIKGIIITCIAVLLYLSLCSWRFDRLGRTEETVNQQFVFNVK